MDGNGKRARWMGVARLPHIDFSVLHEEVERIFPSLPDHIKNRNNTGFVRLYVEMNFRCLSLGPSEARGFAKPICNHFCYKNNTFGTFYCWRDQACFFWYFHILIIIHRRFESGQSSLFFSFYRRRALL